MSGYRMVFPCRDMYHSLLIIIPWIESTVTKSDEPKALRHIRTRRNLATTLYSIHGHRLT